MLDGKFDKSKLPSRHVTEGPARAPHRSYYYAMGMTEEEIHQPLVAESSGAIGQGWRKSSLWHPARIHDHHRHRRDRDGA